MTQRKAFRFYRSYYDVYKELNNKDKLAFIDALLDRQFTGKKTTLTGMAKFAYLSQEFNIESQVKGWEDKTGQQLLENQASQGDTEGGTKRGTEGGTEGGSQEEKEEGKEQHGWREDFEIYKSELRVAYLDLLNNKEWIEQQQEFYPLVDIELSVKKACLNFWATEAGWKNKKQSRSKTIDWKQTITNALSQNQNKVYKPKTTYND